MREEHKLNKAIEQDGVDTQSEILEELKRRYPQYVEQSNKKQTSARKRGFAFISAIAAAAVCVAVIVPCAVLLPNRNSGTDNGGKDNIRYCAQTEYRALYDVEYTIGEYRENNNRNFLYFDWYEFGEDCNTVCYVSKADNEVLCLEENIYLPTSEEFVQISLTKTNVYLSMFDVVFADCNSEYMVDNHTVKWVVNEAKARCIFEDGGYRYFIQVEPTKDENRLFELVEKLLQTK
ncbi:MAG: hypothetical protein K2O04_04710 [Clostridiales bacterium]|nr:hypothetical protein [Clostridiales bacterium]